MALSDISKKELYPYLEKQNLSVEECFNKPNDSTSEIQCLFCKKKFAFKEKLQQESSKHLTRCKEFLKIFYNDSIILREHLGLTTILKDLSIQYCFASPVRILINRKTSEVIVSQDNLYELCDDWEELEGPNIKQLTLFKIEYTKECLSCELPSIENTSSTQGTRRSNDFTPARRPTKQTKPNTPEDFLDVDLMLGNDDNLTKNKSKIYLIFILSVHLLDLCFQYSNVFHLIMNLNLLNTQFANYASAQELLFFLHMESLI